MSEVTTLNSNARPELYGVKGGRQASPDTTRQAAKEGGKSLPPSVSLEPAKRSYAEKQGERQAQMADNVRDAVAQMNEYIQATQRDLRFSVDEASGETVVKVLDRQTEEVIRQIPDETFLELARNLSVDEPVHFFSEQA